VRRRRQRGDKENGGSIGEEPAANRGAGEGLKLRRRRMTHFHQRGRVEQSKVRQGLCLATRSSEKQHR